MLFIIAFPSVVLHLTIKFIFQMRAYLGMKFRNLNFQSSLKSEPHCVIIRVNMLRITNFVIYIYIISDVLVI